MHSLDENFLKPLTFTADRLEGITAPHQRIAELVTQDTMPKDRSEQEKDGVCRALDQLLQGQVPRLRPQVRLGAAQLGQTLPSLECTCCARQPGLRD